MEKINKLDNFIRKIILGRGSRVRWREERKERRRKVQVLFSDTWGEFRALNFRGRPRGRWDAARHVTCKFWSGRDDDQVYKGKGKLNIATSQGSSSRRGKKERERDEILTSTIFDREGRWIVQTILWHERNLVSSRIRERGRNESRGVWIKYLQRYFERCNTTPWYVSMIEYR